MENISKKALVDEVASKVSLSKKDTQAVIDATIDQIVNFVKKGHKVSLIGFGGFYPYRTKAAEKKNPKTGAPVKVPAKTILKFKASKNLQELLK